MRVTRTIFGVLGLLVGAAVLAGSLGILVDDRDADDFFVSETQTFSQPSFAIVSEDIDVLTDAPSWLAEWLTDPVDVRLRGTSNTATDIFIGIAPAPELREYLEGVAYHEITSIDLEGDAVEYKYHPGPGTVPAPGEATFWTASTVGPGAQTLDWSLRSGEYAAVVMNADGASDIDVDMVLGAKITGIIALAWIGVVFGALSLLGGLIVIYLAFAGRGGEPGQPADYFGEAKPRSWQYPTA